MEFDRNKTPECINLDVGVLDTEASNFSMQAEVIQFAITMPSEDLNTINTEDFYIKPIEPVDAEAMSISWITNESLVNMGSFTNIVNQINADINQFDYICCHNYAYDKAILEHNYELHNLQVPDIFNSEDNWICTLKLARKLFPELPQYKLGFLWFNFELYKHYDEQINPHDASSDIIMCKILLEYIAQYMIQEGIVQNDDTLIEQIIEYQNTPVYLDKFPFGKYKGSDPKDIPNSYYDWLLSKSTALDEESKDYNADLAFTILTVLNERL